MILPFVALLMAICSLLVWLGDRGPIFFKRPRTGMGGRQFAMYKFRTMVTDAEQLKLKYAHLNHHTGPDFKIRNDPRVTRVGGFLRKTSLDEIPQIINVLRGEMSLVGPRPTSFDLTAYSLWHTERLEVLPGITGLSQINGRGEVDFDERVRHDIEYIENRSFWLDVKILFLTFKTVFSLSAAY
jgi:lipopolysaccharide/colanic/teichoic acid biosynthesis glycosyltransferase